MSWSQCLTVAFLVLAAFGAGFWLDQIEARKKRGGWREYRPSTNPLRDYK